MRNLTKKQIWKIKTASQKIAAETKREDGNVNLDTIIQAQKELDKAINEAKNE